MKKTALILAALLAVSSILTSCGDTPSDTKVTTGGSESTDPVTDVVDYLDTLPKEDYNGYEFRIIAQSYDQRPNLPLAEEENGEVLNDAIIRRNRLVEERLGIKIVNYPDDDRSKVTEKVKNTVLADDNAYDLVINSVNIGINTLMSEGCLYDLSALKYLDFSKEWWCASVNEDFTVNGHLYFTTGPLSPFFYYMPAAVAYNKTLTDENGITGLEDLVRSGKWTFDKLKELTVGKSVDINGDTKMTDEDKYAIAGSAGDCYMLAGFGEKMSERENDRFVLNMGKDGFITKLEALAKYFSDEKTFFNSQNTAIFLNMFESDRAMFMPTSMNNLITGYDSVPSAREMKSDYGILPLPKYDEAQEKYYTIGQPAGPSGIAVPASCRDTDRTSLVMETMAYYSNDLIREAAYDKIIKGKAARVEGTEDMLDIVYHNVFFDVNYVFNFGKTKDLVTTALENGGESFSSSYASALESANKAIDDYMELINDLG